MQFKLAPPLNQLLHREPAFPVHHHDVPAPGRARAIDNQGVPRLDPKAHHRGAGVRLGEEGGDWVGDAVLVEVQAVAGTVEVLCGAWEATGDVDR